MTLELTMAVMPAMVVVVMATATSRRVFFCHENHHNDGKNSHDGGEGEGDAADASTDIWTVWVKSMPVLLLKFQ